MYAFPSLLIVITFPAVSSTEYPPVCASYNCLSRQCLLMLPLRLSIYTSLQPRSQLLCLRLAGSTIFTGSIPTSDSIGISKMKAHWSPTPYPNGITHALLILMSLDTHNQSIGFDPLKNVAPGLSPVCWMIASRKSSPSLSACALPRAP